MVLTVSVRFPSPLPFFLPLPASAVRSAALAASVPAFRLQPPPIVTMHEKAEAAAETMEQLKEMQQTEQPKPAEEEKKEEVKENEPKQ